MSHQTDRLLRIMARLRDPKAGCEWDRAQTFSTIAPYTIEEAYEVADAIERADMDALRGELGDLLFQVVFHARMAEESGDFSYEDVARDISDKMEARHPHIFGDEGGIMEDSRWEEIKAAERAAAGSTSAMDGVALALPALLRSDKLQKRAARVGFEWPDIEGPIQKLHEELGELAHAETEGDRLMEAGDVLFVAVNIVRRYGVDPEQALRASNGKFERRFKKMERQGFCRTRSRYAGALLATRKSTDRLIQRLVLPHFLGIEPNSDEAVRTVGFRFDIFKHFAMRMQPGNAAAIAGGHLEAAKSSVAGQHASETIEQSIDTVSSQSRHGDNVVVSFDLLAQFFRVVDAQQVPLVPDLQDRDRRISFPIDYAKIAQYIKDLRLLRGRRGVRNIPHMADDVGRRHFLQRSAEGGDQLCRQIGYEAHCIRQDRLFDAWQGYCPHCRIECCE